MNFFHPSTPYILYTYSIRVYSAGLIIFPLLSPVVKAKYHQIPIERAANSLGINPGSKEDTNRTFGTLLCNKSAATVCAADAKPEEDDCMYRTSGTP